MLVVNSILIGLVVMLIVTTLIEKHHNRRSMNIKEEQIMSLTKMIVDQNNITTSLTKEVDNTVKTSAKVLGIINKMNSGLKKSIQNIDLDMNNVVNMIKAITHAQMKGMKAHNDLVNYTVEELGKVWCDLCDNDCEICPYENTCKNWEPKESPEGMFAIDEEGLPFPVNDQCEPDLTTPSEDDIKPFVVGDYDDRNCAGSMTINPGDPEQIERLLDKMKETGMPDAVLRRYKAAIEEAVRKCSNHPDKLDIIWKSEFVDPSIKRDKRVTNPIKDENKLIDPNSKIVKSLEKLLKESK